MRGKCRSVVARELCLLIQTHLAAADNCQQIWFQNRRQIQRRKSRPLLPHEIAAFGIGYLAAVSSDAASAPIFISSQGVGELVMSSQEEEPAKTQETEVADSQGSIEVSEPLQVETSVEVAHTLLTVSDTTPILEREPSSGDNRCEASSFSNSGVFKSFSSTPGYLANRWNATRSSFSTPTSSQATPITNPTM